MIGLKVFNIVSLCFIQIAPVWGSTIDESKICRGNRALHILYMFLRQLFFEQACLLTLKITSFNVDL